MNINKNYLASAIARDVLNAVIVEMQTLTKEQEINLLRTFTARIASWFDDAERP